jgi:hypothetical protein
MATTIHNLEVSFEVQDESDEARFARLFDKHFKRCNRMEAETKNRECRLDAEMALIGRHKEDLA